MFVDDHNEMFGGISDALTVRISREELRELESKPMLRAKNTSGRGIIVIIMVEDDPRPISAS